MNERTKVERKVDQGTIGNDTERFHKTHNKGKIENKGKKQEKK